MKTILLIAAVMLIGMSIATAQDVVKVAPKLVKVLLENDRVRVLDFQLKAGDKVAMHSHPAGFVYGITAGKSKTTFPDGKSTETEFKAGEARWSEPVTHANEAITNLHVLVIELKEADEEENGEK